MTRSIDLRQVRKHLADLEARGPTVAIGLNSPRTSAGGVGLGVERVDVRRAAGQPDQDAVPHRCRGASTPTWSAAEARSRNQSSSPRPRNPSEPDPEEIATARTGTVDRSAGLTWADS